MASRRTTYDKLQRERAKKAKAALKRERRQEQPAERTDATPAAAYVTNDSQDDLLAKLAVTHARFEANELTFEEFDKLKTGLLDRLAALPIDS